LFVFGLLLVDSDFTRMESLFLFTQLYIQQSEIKRMKRLVLQLVRYILLHLNPKRNESTTTMNNLSQKVQITTIPETEDN